MSKFDRTTCDIVARAIRRTQPDAELMLDMLGLIESTGRATHRDNGGSKGNRQVTRRPLWEEVAYPDLRPVGGKGVGHAGAGWAS